MPTITQDEISLFKAYRDDVKGFLNGAEIPAYLFGPDDSGNNAKILGQDKYEYLCKARELVGERMFTPIERVIHKFLLPGAVERLQKRLNEIKADLKGLDWIQVEPTNRYERRLVPNFGETQGFQKLIDELEYVINEAEKAAGQKLTEGSGGKADLPNSIPTKIWAMLCKLYEITLKVIADAILDRFWPKPQ
jgi:hypothetical protein